MRNENNFIFGDDNRRELIRNAQRNVQLRENDDMKRLRQCVLLSLIVGEGVSMPKARRERC